MLPPSMLTPEPASGSLVQIFASDKSSCPLRHYFHQKVSGLTIHPKWVVEMWKICRKLQKILHTDPPRRRVKLEPEFMDVDLEHMLGSNRPGPGPKRLEKLSEESPKVLDLPILVGLCLDFSFL